MKKFWNIFKKVMLVLSVTAFVVLFVFTLTSAVRQQKTLVCSSIQVKIDEESGVSFLTSDEIKAKINSLAGGEIVGKPLAQLDFRAIETGLMKNPFVYQAKVYIDHARVVHANIVQKQPLIRIINNDGVGYYLSDKADKIPLCGKFTAHVPVAIGVVETREDLYGDSIILSEVYSMAKYMQQDSVLGSMIDHIYVLESGELELYTKMGYHTIAFGRADATMIEKLNKLKIFYREGMTKVGWDKYSVINLKYKGQVVCERKTAEVPAKPKKKEEPEKQETEKQDIN
jgi:cell division protein FtsQ